METCDTLAHHWFWEAGDALKSVRTLVRLYHSTVDRGANLLLDLAPDKTGRIPEATAKRLMEMKAALTDTYFDQALYRAGSDGVGLKRL